MSNILGTIQHIKHWEGGWSDKPNDRGGATMSGITIGTYREVYGKSKTKEDLRNITDEEWMYIFRTRYWDPFKADKIHNASIATLCVDMAFNSGTINAIKRVQRCLGTTPDGIVGPKTLALLNDPNSAATFQKIAMMRRNYYYALASKPGQRGNLNGWLNRLNAIKYDL